MPSWLCACPLRKQAIFGIPGNKPRWCSACPDKPAEAEDVKNKRCGCPRRKRLMYGMPGEQPRWCARCPDKPTDAVNMVSKMCACESRRVPCYGMPGGTVQWCSRCPDKPADAVNVVSKPCSCEHRKIPIYGLPGGRPRWCAQCPDKPAEAVDVSNRRCACEFRRQPAYGMPGGRAQWCAQCPDKPKEAVNVRGKKCACPLGTQKAPTFGMPGDRPRWCASCSPAGAVDVVNKMCMKCGIAQVKRKFDMCASCDTKNKRPTRVRENRVANAFREAGVAWTAWNKQLTERACGLYRPDFVFDAGTHVVIVEVDEDQHKAYDPACENKRMMDVFNSFGGTRVVFIRWNPDKFEVDGVERRVPEKMRHAALVQELQRALATLPVHVLSIVRMYYDGGVTRRTWVDPTVPAFVEMC